MKRTSGYHYIISDRKTGAVIVEGDCTGGNKTDCEKAAWIQFNNARHDQDLAYKPHYTTNDEIKLYMERNGDF